MVFVSIFHQRAPRLGTWASSPAMPRKRQWHSRDERWGVRGAPYGAERSNIFLRGRGRPRPPWMLAICIKAGTTNWTTYFGSAPFQGVFLLAKVEYIYKVIQLFAYSNSFIYLCTQLPLYSLYLIAITLLFYKLSYLLHHTWCGDFVTLIGIMKLHLWYYEVTP